MDGHRFDAIAGALARATTRRRVLGGLLGSVGALVAIRLNDAAAQSTTAGVAEAINAYRTANATGD